LKIRPVLTLVSRDYCHLCEEMHAALRQLQGRFSFDIEVVDVDSRPDLEAAWGDKVPVLLHGDEEVCHYHLEAEALGARMARIE